MSQPEALQHEGGCLCGHVRYRFAGAPLMTAVCHCRHCQRQSGSAFSMVCVIPNDAYEQLGETKVFEDVGASGKSVLRHFCPDCGSPITSIAEAIPGMTIIKAGTLDQPGQWVPTLEAFCDQAMPWLQAIADERHAQSNMGAE